MTSEFQWRIPPDAADWECSYEAAERFHLRAFRALPFAEKLQAVEEMCELAEEFRKRAEEKRRSRTVSPARSDPSRPVHPSGKSRFSPERTLGTRTEP